jgi:hypothetical protein
MEELRKLAPQELKEASHVEIDAQGVVCWFAQKTKYAQVSFLRPNQIRLELWDRARREQPFPVDFFKDDDLSAIGILERVQEFFST